MDKKEALISTIKNKINQKEADIAFLFAKINQEAIISINENKVFSSASTIKVVVMLVVLEEVKNERLSLKENILVKKEQILSDTEFFKEEKEYSLYQLIEKMITVSDNTATNVLIELITKEKINRYIKENLKLEKTVLNRKMLDFSSLEKGIDNFTTPKEMYEIFRKIFSNEILNPKLIKITKEILLKQEDNNQLNKYFKRNACFYHKTGELDYLNHDVGVLKIKDELYYLAIFVANSENILGEKELAAEIGKEIYDYLTISK